jgi:hypothetical protein
MDGGQTAEHSGARTDPMDMKNPKVAAEESMYCDSVATTPLGPGPALRRSVSDQRSAISGAWRGLGVGSTRDTGTGSPSGRADLGLTR